MSSLSSTLDTFGSDLASIFTNGLSTAADAYVSQHFTTPAAIAASQVPPASVQPFTAAVSSFTVGDWVMIGLGVAAAIGAVVLIAKHG